jgi:molecular chaperone HscB
VNSFEVFGLDRKLAVDTAKLQARYYELSRRYHPDFQQSASPEDQARALEQSALLNAAYRTLRDPLARIEYLVRLEEGRETKEGATEKPKAPPDLLAEIFEIQELLQEAREGGLAADDRARLREERDALAARRRDEEAQLTGALSAAWDAAAPTERARVIDALKEGLARRSYLRTVIDDLDAALDESQESHVTHHRH